MGLTRFLRKPWGRSPLQDATVDGNGTPRLALPPAPQPAADVGPRQIRQRKTPRDIREWIEFRARANGATVGTDEPRALTQEAVPERNGWLRGRLVSGLESYLAQSAAELDERGDVLFRRERQLAHGERQVEMEEQALADRHERITTQLHDTQTVETRIHQLVAEQDARGRRITGLEETISDREAKLRIAEARLAESDRVLADREARAHSQSAELEKQRLELHELRTKLERGADALQAAESRVSDLEKRLSGRGSAQRRDGPGADSHLLFVPGTTRYSMIERAGDPPSVGSEVAVFLEDREQRFQVSKLTSSPLPSDGRPCAYLQPAF